MKKEDVGEKRKAKMTEEVKDGKAAKAAKAASGSMKKCRGVGCRQN